MNSRKRQRQVTPRSNPTWPSRSVAATQLALALGLLLSGCARDRLLTRPAPDRRPAARARTPVLPTAPQLEAAGNHPRVRTLVLGHSVRGGPLKMHVFGDGPDRVFIFGGIHGDEPTSTTVARELIGHLRKHPESVAGRTVAILPDANPDGLLKRRRANANSVDLNRNFPAKNWRRSRRDGLRHGSAPASEPETRAIMRAVELIRPRRIVSIHSTARGQHCNNYDGPAKELAELMARSNGYPVRASMGYPTPGSFGSWAGIDRAIPTITLELPRDLDAERCWRENAAALLALIEVDVYRVGQ